MISGRLPSAGKSVASRSLPNAEVAEDDVQNVLDPDAAREPLHRARGDTDLLGDQLLCAAGSKPKGRLQGLPGLAQCHAMTFASDDARRTGEENLAEFAQRLQQCVGPLTGFCRYG